MKPVIFFDWDGTLADSMDLSREGVRIAFEEMGLPPCPPEKMIYCNGPTIEESAVLMELPEALHEEYIRRRYAAEMRVLDRVQKLFPGVGDMLRRLREHADIVIISNGSMQYLTTSAHLTGVEDCFTAIQGLIPGQIKGVTLGQVIQRMQPERAIMVGDRVGDFVAGKTCGLQTMAVQYGYGTAEEWAKADCAVETVEELEQWLTRWAEKE